MRKIAATGLSLCLLASVLFTGAPAFAEETEETVSHAVSQAESGEEPASGIAEGTAETSAGADGSADEEKDESASSSSSPAVSGEEAQQSSSSQAEPETLEPEQAELTSIEDILDLARHDGAKAADLLNQYIETDKEAFLAGVKEVLDAYYTQEETGQLELFSKEIDALAAELLTSYRLAAEERSAAQLNYVPGEVLLIFEEQVSQKQADEVVLEQAGEVVETLEAPAEETAVVVEIPLEQTVEQAVEQYATTEEVQYAQPNYLYSLPDDGQADASSWGAGSGQSQYQPQWAYVNDSYFYEQWYLDKIKTFEAWDYITSMPHQKVRVAVIDTGLDIYQEDLQKNVNFPLSVDVTRTTSSGAYPRLKKDMEIHGTHVAGTIAATANNYIGVTGAASGYNNDLVELIAINTFTYHDAEGEFSADTVAVVNAINWAVDKKARVINMSLGYLAQGYDYWDWLLEGTIDNAVSDGVVVVCAAGNENSKKTFYPADYANTISVIAIKDFLYTSSSYCKANFSNYGPTKDISAPGENILNAGPEDEYWYMYGTSQAAPIVTSVVAMMLSVNPDLTPDEVREILHYTATDLGPKGFDEKTGWGQVNAEDAVICAVEPPEVSKVTLNKTSTAMALGSTQKLQASITPRIARTSLKWTSSDPSIVKVSSAGTMTALKLGSAKITVVTNNGKKATCNVKVVLSAPQNVKASKYAATKIKVSWSAVKDASAYEIYRSTSKNGTYQLVKKTALTSYMDSGLARGKTYYYKIRAYQNATASTKSNSSAVTAGVPLALSAPTGVTVRERSVNSLQIAWKKVTNATKYSVYRGTSKSGTFKKIGSVGSALYYNDTGLTKGSTYYYKVRAEASSASYLSGYSSVASQKVRLAPPQKVKVARSTASSLKISWEKVWTASGYYVYRATSKGGTYRKVATLQGNTAVTYLDKGLTAGKTYYYQVRAYSSTSANSLSRGSTIVSEYPTPAKVARLKVTKRSATSVTVSWSAVKDASGYEITRATSKTGTYFKVKTISKSSTTSWVYSGLKKGRKYYFKIRAYQLVNGKKVYGPESYISLVQM